MAVLSTLSGTIAIKQYLSNMTGYDNVFFNLSIVYGVQISGITVFLHDFFFNSGSPSIPPRLTDLVKLAQECCYHSNLAVAAHGVIVLSNIVISCPEKGL